MYNISFIKDMYLIYIISNNKKRKQNERSEKKKKKIYIYKRIHLQGRSNPDEMCEKSKKREGRREGEGVGDKGKWGVAPGVTTAFPILHVEPFSMLTSPSPAFHCIFPSTDNILMMEKKKNKKSR